MAQVIRPGAPVLFGGAPATFHMKIASSPMAAIEALQLDVAYVAVAKSLGLPTQSYMALSDAKTLDAQAGAETFGSALLAALAGVNSVSGPGMLDFLLVFSLPKLVFDDAMCGQVLHFVREVRELDDLPVHELIDQLMADQHLIMAPHTTEHWPTELFLPVDPDRPRQPRGVDAGRRRRRSTSGRPTRSNRRLARLPPARDGPGDRRGAAADHPVRAGRPDGACRSCRRRRSRPSPRMPARGGATTGGDPRVDGPRLAASRVTRVARSRRRDHEVDRLLEEPAVGLRLRLERPQLGDVSGTSSVTVTVARSRPSPRRQPPTTNPSRTTMWAPRTSATFRAFGSEGSKIGE